MNDLYYWIGLIVFWIACSVADFLIWKNCAISAGREWTPKLSAISICLAVCGPFALGYTLWYIKQRNIPQND